MDDPIDARAISISAGRRTYVVVSVVAQGLHENYIEDMRARVRAARPGISDVVVSANHNESSPDTVGIYGGPAEAGTVGLNSGIDEYYMDFVVEQVAQAAKQAYLAMQPASLWVREFPVPAGQHIVGGYWVIPICLFLGLLVLVFNHRGTMKFLSWWRSRGVRNVRQTDAL